MNSTSLFLQVSIENFIQTSPNFRNTTSLSSTFFTK